MRGVRRAAHPSPYTCDAIRCDRPSEIYSWKSSRVHKPCVCSTRPHAHARRLLVSRYELRKLSVAGGTSTAALPAAVLFSGSCQMLLPSKVLSPSGGTSTHLRRNRKRFLFSIIFAAENTFPACRGGILNFTFGAAMFFVGRVGFFFFCTRFNRAFCILS